MADMTLKLYTMGGSSHSSVPKRDYVRTMKDIHNLEDNRNSFKIIKANSTTIIFQHNHLEHQRGLNPFTDLDLDINTINKYFINMGFEFNIVVTSATTNIINFNELQEGTSLEDFFEQIPWFLRFNKKVLQKAFKLKYDLSLLYYYVDEESEDLYDLTFLYNIYRYHNEIKLPQRSDNIDRIICELYYSVMNLLDYDKILNKEYAKFLIYLKNIILINYSESELHIIYKLIEI